MQKQVTLINFIGSLFAMASILVLLSRGLDLSDNAWITLVSMSVLLTAFISLCYNNLRIVQEKTKVWLTPILILICNCGVFVLGIMLDHFAIQDDVYMRAYYPSGIFVLLLGIAMPFGMIWWHLSWSSKCKTLISKFLFNFFYVGVYTLFSLWSLLGLYFSSLQSI